MGSIPDELGVAVGEGLGASVGEGAGESLAVFDALALGVGLVADAEVQPVRTITIRLVAPSTDKRKPTLDATELDPYVVRLE